MSDLPNVVLVHGAWADGSSWTAVIESLHGKGYNVTAPQFPETSTEDDVARLRQALARLEGTTIVAGHSYGGQIMTALGADAPNVAALVYVAAFGLDEGESLGALLGAGPPTPALATPGGRRAGLRLAARGGLRRPLRRRRRPGRGARPARRPAADLDEHLRVHDGRPGLEVAAHLVRRRDRATRRSRPTPSASSRQRMGATTVEVAVGPPGDGHPPRGSRRADRTGSEGHCRPRGMR